MSTYTIEFRSLEYARTVYRILREESIANKSFGPDKLKMNKSTIQVSPDIYSKLEKVVEKHLRMIRRVTQN